MSRKLYVSTDISVDEALAEIADEDPVAALLWPWLLVHLDDWGRSSASARRLKAAVAPMMVTITIEVIRGALERYAAHGLIALYEVDGHEYLAVNPEKWWRYQTHIHKSKRDDDQSLIPAPPAGVFRKPRGNSRKLAETRGELRDSAQNCASPPPSSLHLPPSTFTSTHIDTSADAEVVDASPPPDDIDWDGTASSEPQTTLPIERISYKRIIEMWKATCPSLPAIIEIKGDRQQRTKRLFELVGGYQGLEEFFKRVEASDFLAGRNPSKTHPHWRANYDFVTQRKTVIKILEGTHDNRRPTGMSKTTADMVALAKKWEEAENEGK